MMSAADYVPSYFALRVCPLGIASAWWQSARDAPPAIRALLAGRTRVELSEDEVVDVLAWARGLDGWDAEPHAPVWIYTPPAPDS